MFAPIKQLAERSRRRASRLGKNLNRTLQAVAEMTHPAVPGFKARRESQRLGNWIAAGRWCRASWIAGGLSDRAVVSVVWLRLWLWIFGRIAEAGFLVVV
ncbi:hypothetical protein [Nocardia salmonicida]|uniref:hypothetical protein n=1 Tax=Nocardia salmonicida TaxID=53431 RepID=UPI003CF5E994